MFALTKLFASFSALADAVSQLALTVRQADQGVRQRLQLDGPEPGDPPALPAPADTRRRPGGCQ
jgi:hypothetical protein